ncbi:DUF554 domain-containing protein [Frischella sp. Ac48]|uniref:DUF554 domain-containing protein n=1 Tax=Frischella japonica TaxID=2741544 RepID=A0ABR7QW62_9GAMM|nr:MULTISPECIES: DUF554 domain-containing protein [Frischella]MBC9130454.1 DUF554 domain-containing protein [Frischella japonica]MBX4132342.1 DUF554 domain-containing protein [Frischella sp. Ac48]
MIGPIINGAAIIVGGLIGASVGKTIPARVREALPMTFGCAAIGIGVALITKIHTIPAVVLALLIGSLIGELLQLERGIEKLSLKLRLFFDKPNAKQPLITSHEDFIEKYVALVVLFCASGMGIFGALTEGISADPSLLIAKAFLDFFTAIIFAITLGYAVSLIAIPQFLIQAALFLLASVIQPLISDSMFADFSACGGIIMLATGFRICNIKLFPVANMLFALIIVMPISAIWLDFI